MREPSCDASFSLQSTTMCVGEEARPQHPMNVFEAISVTSSDGGGQGYKGGGA